MLEVERLNLDVDITDKRRVILSLTHPEIDIISDKVALMTTEDNNKVIEFDDNGNIYKIYRTIQDYSDIFDDNVRVVTYTDDEYFGQSKKINTLIYYEEYKILYRIKNGIPMIRNKYNCIILYYDPAFNTVIGDIELIVINNQVGKVLFNEIISEPPLSDIPASEAKFQFLTASDSLFGLSKQGYPMKRDNLFWEYTDDELRPNNYYDDI